jgi:predicted transcriptional regulator
MAQSVLEMAKDLVMAQIVTRRLPPEDMQKELHKTYTTLMALQQQEETGATGPVTEQTPLPQPRQWKQSIRKQTVACLECGKTFKQLSVKHLKDHGLDPLSYRAKYGIPRRQPLAAKDTTARRKVIVQRTKPWEKNPRYQKAHGEQSDGKPTGTTGQAKRRSNNAKKAVAD